MKRVQGEYNQLVEMLCKNELAVLIKEYLSDKELINHWRNWGKAVRNS